MNRHLSITTLLLLFFTYYALGQNTNEIDPEAAGFSKQRLERYNALLEKEVENAKLPGAVIMIARKGKLAHFKALGYSDWDDKTPMKEDHIFFIQSMTKPIITAALMTLYEEGLFVLSDPVSKYLPKFADLKVAKDINKGSESETVALDRPITIKHLLTHTAGFTHGLGSSKLDMDTRQRLYYQPHQDIKGRVDALLSLPLYGQPGDQWYYSAATDVVSLLIEHFSGMTTEEYLKKKFFEPLGMKDTGYNLSKEQQDRMASLHIYGNDGKIMNSPRQTPMEGNTIHGGANGLFSTASDYIKFCQMMLNGGSYNGHQILSRKTIELMTVDHVGELYTNKGQGFGLGFGIITDLGEFGLLGTKGQYAWGGAYSTYFFIDPKEELAAVLMTQIAPYNNYFYTKSRQMVYQALVK